MIAGYGSDGFSMEDVASTESSDGWAGLGWGEAFEVSRHPLRTIPFDSMSFADNRIEAGVEELTHIYHAQCSVEKGGRLQLVEWFARLS